jgi:hypothetical protein
LRTPKLVLPGHFTCLSLRPDATRNMPDQR